MSDLPLTREERSGDISGTPHGLVGLADDRDELAKLKRLTAEDEANVLVEFPVSDITAKYRGYSRFVQFREPIRVAIGVTKAFAIVQEPRAPGAMMASTTGSSILPPCNGCGYRVKPDHGICPACGTVKDS